MKTLYGIKNCDTVRKAQKWLQSQQIDYQFHDFRSDGLSVDQLEVFTQHLGWEALLNRNSTSWRQLNESQRLNLDAEKAFQLMLEIPTIIKRPIFVDEDKIIIGFKPDQYASLLGMAK